MKEKIINEIVETVKKIVGGEGDVQYMEVEKNNGVKLPAVIIKEPRISISPTIYIDGIIEKIAMGEISTQKASEEIVNIYKFNQPAEVLTDILKGFDKKDILSRVVYQVVNKEQNAERLVSLPHKDFLDLAAIYKVVISEGEFGMTSITVNHQFCGMYGIDEKEIESAARLNTEKRGFCIRSFEDVLAGLLAEVKHTHELPEEVSNGFHGRMMFVISSDTGINGASVLLYPDYLYSLAYKLGSDLYVLPSSIYEVIALPVGTMVPDELTELVAEVNSTCVDKQEVLGGNVYRCSLKDGNISIA